MNRRNFLAQLAGTTMGMALFNRSLMAQPLTMHSQTPLVLYLSRTGNTQAVAQMIATATGGKLLPITLQPPYPQNYQQTVDQVRAEDERGFLPPLAMDLSIIQHYQQIFIGFPTWAMQLPPPIRSLLSAVNWQQKTIIPFNTNAGYGIGSTFRELKTLARGAQVRRGFSTHGGVERDGILLAIKDERAQEVNQQVLTWLQQN